MSDYDPTLDPARIRAYRALGKAADRIGLSNYRRGMDAWRRAGKHPLRYRPYVSEAHRRVIDAMSDVLGGRISVEEAMAILHEYDVEKERTG